MLKVDQIKGSRAKPGIVSSNGHVVTFTVGNMPVQFTGSILHIGNDGNVYAVFNSVDEARLYSAYFIGCREVLYDNFPAYKLDKVH